MPRALRRGVILLTRNLGQIAPDVAIVPAITNGLGKLEAERLTVAEVMPKVQYHDATASAAVASIAAASSASTSIPSVHESSSVA